MSTAPVTLVNANPGALGATYTTASVSPAANTRAIVFGTYDKASLLASKPTITDSLGTITWTEIGNIHTSNATNPDLWLVAWISNDLGATPAAMTVTVAATGARAGTASIITVLSADTNGTAQQTASAEALVTGGPTFTFGSAPGASNLVVGCNWHGGGNAITKPVGYTNLYDNTPTNVVSRRHEVFYDNTSAAQGPNFSSASNPRSVVLAIELAPAGAATQNITGALFTDGDTFFATTLTPGDVAITGALFSNANTVFAATVSQAGASQDITGALFSNANSFFGSTVSASYAISGAIFTDADTFFGATISASAGIAGSLYTNANSFFGAVVSQAGDQAIAGALYANDNLFFGATAQVDSGQRDGDAVPSRSRPLHVFYYEKEPEKPVKKVKRRVSVARVKKAIEDLETYDDVPWVPSPEAAKLILPDYIAVFKTNADEEQAIIAAIRRAIIMKAIEEDEEDIEMLLLAA